MSFRRRITTAVLGSALVLAAVLAVSSPASAAVGDGYGGQGQTDTQCQSSVARPQGYGFSATVNYEDGSYTWRLGGA